MSGSDDALHQAARDRELGLTRDTLAQGFSIDQMHQAARYGNVGLARDLLAQGLNIDQMHPYGWTPLHEAVWYGQLEFVRFRVDQGANLEARNPIGNAPLHCTPDGHPNFLLFQFLVSSGANIRTRNSAGGSILHAIILNQLDPCWMYLLFDAAGDERAWFLMKDMFGNTPLHCTGSVAVAKHLVEYGFDPSAIQGVRSVWMCPTLFSSRNKKGKTPCEVAKDVQKSRIDTERKKKFKAVAKYLDSFESLPLVDPTTMKLSAGLNEFQRSLARRIYSTTLCRLHPGRDVVLRVMAFLFPADVMKR
jgi:hypothetical protein